ncbi:MAG: aminotransferase class I/II-fold pyridoxal phosphate-dependent enzyme [Acidobacteriota bacterium]|nr:aminotransferase class I/II-fold pyridoxal phosphate-dependent enzyme [Acidobacteriota bacterium]
MPAPTAPAPVRVSSRISGFVYAIRNIVAEARRVEAGGTRVRYLNIGDPIAFGFATPPHLIEAVSRAMRDGHNGYTQSIGILDAREAVAEDYTRRGMPVSPDHVVLTSGTSEGIELALGALADDGDEVLVPVPTYPLYTAVLAKLGARAVHYRLDPANGWHPDLDDIRRRISRATRALVVIDPNNPTGAVYPEATRRALLAIASEHNVPVLADEVYGELGYHGAVPPLASFDTDAPVISFSSLSKAYLAPGWRAGWLAVGSSHRMDDVLGAIRKLADGRLCSPGPMQHAISAALRGDRSHQRTFIDDLKARAAISVERLGAIDGITCVTPQSAFYAMPKVALPPGVTDEDYVVALLRETGVLCVYGSGFGLPAEDGFFRVVFLASPKELHEIYDLIAAFTPRFLAKAAAGRQAPGVGAR